MPDHHIPPGSHGCPLRTGRDLARDQRPGQAIPAPSAHQPGFRRGTALRHAGGHRQDLYLDPSHRRVRAGPAEVPPHGLRAWIEIVAHHAATTRMAPTSTLRRAQPALLDKRLLSGRYRRPPWPAGTARSGWVERICWLPGSKPDGKGGSGFGGPGRQAALRVRPGDRPAGLPCKKKKKKKPGLPTERTSSTAPHGPATQSGHG